MTISLSQAVFLLTIFLSTNLYWWWIAKRSYTEGYRDGAHSTALIIDMLGVVPSNLTGIVKKCLNEAKRNDKS